MTQSAVTRNGSNGPEVAEMDVMAMYQQKLPWKCLPKVFYSFHAQMLILAEYLEHNPDGI